MVNILVKKKTMLYLDKELTNYCRLKANEASKTFSELVEELLIKWSEYKVSASISKHHPHLGRHYKLVLEAIKLLQRRGATGFKREYYVCEEGRVDALCNLGNVKVAVECYISPYKKKLTQRYELIKPYVDLVVFVVPMGGRYSETDNSWETVGTGYVNRSKKALKKYPKESYEVLGVEQSILGGV